MRGIKDWLPAIGTVLLIAMTVAVCALAGLWAAGLL